MKSQNRSQKPVTRDSNLAEIGEILANAIHRLIVKESQKNKANPLDSPQLESVHGYHK
jgi:hypothetical protein